MRCFWFAMASLKASGYGPKATIVAIHPLRKPSRDKLPSMRCRDRVRATFSPQSSAPRIIDHREGPGPRRAIATRPLEILYQEKITNRKAI